MIRAFAVLLCLALLAGCQSSAPTPITNGSTSEYDPIATTIPHQTVSATMGGYEVAIITLPQWEVFAAHDSVILAEHGQSIQNPHNSDGMLARMFIADTGDYAYAADADNTALSLLEYVVAQPTFIGSASVTEPRGFTWSGYDAAYYTLDSGGDWLTLLMAAYLDDGAPLVVNISVPRARQDELATLLPNILHEITFGEWTLHHDGLAQLPKPLRFPNDTLEVADSAP